MVGASTKQSKSAKQTKRERYILHDVIPPIMDEGYEQIPSGYILFPSYEDYKKIKNIDKTISRFLERRSEIATEEKLYKCLEIIESTVEVCDEMRLDINIEHTFNVPFPNIIKFIEKVDYDYEDNKLKDVGDNIENESKRVKDKYIKIVETLYEKNIWLFEG